MSRPLVYHYYGGKAGVFISALRQTGEDLMAAIADAGLADPDNWLAAGLAAFFDHIYANPIALTALIRQGSLAGGEDRRVLDEFRDRMLALILEYLGSPGDSAVLQSVLRGWIAMVETMGHDWLRRDEPPREELETLLPELLRAVLGTAAWHDAAVAAVLPSLPPLKPVLKHGPAAPARRGLSDEHAGKLRKDCIHLRKDWIHAYADGPARGCPGGYRLGGGPGP